MRVAPRTLRRQLARRGVTICEREALRSTRLRDQQRPRPYRRFQRDHFGDLWQGDAMDGPRLPDPANPDRERQVFLFAFLDDYTRLIPHAQFYWNEQLPRMEDCLKRAILRYGRPVSLYVDRGKVYTATHFDTTCATAAKRFAFAVGIQRILGTPYYPEGRGKIERFFQFVQSDFLPELACAAVTTLSQLNESLLAWVEVVYHRKVHTETGQSPLERHRQDDTPTTRTVDPTELRQAFLHREQRQVTTTATFSFQGNRYRVAAFLRHQQVQLRFDPFDLTHLEVWFQDTFLQLAEPERIVSTVHPDVDPDPLPTPPSANAKRFAVPGTGLDYLALLRGERERLLQQQLQGIRFSQLTEGNDDPAP